MTFRSVLSELEPYVPGRPITGGIKLSSNENPLGTSPKALAAIEHAMTTCARYPDMAMTALRTALGKRWGVRPEMVVVGNGSDEIMMMIAGALLEPGTNAVTSEHTFSQYAFVSRVHGAEVRVASMSDGTISLEEMASLVDERTRIVWICNPNNPTGTIVPAAQLDAFVRSLPDHVLIVLDEAYGEYVTSDEFPDSLELVHANPNVIRLRTFSKIYGLAALRVGYGIASETVITQVGKLRQPFNVGTFGQAAAVAALADDEFVERSLANNRSEMRRIESWLGEHGIGFYPSQANFVCVDFGPDARSIVESAIDRGISLRWLGSFGLPNHIRITVGTEPEVDALFATLDAVTARLPCGLR